LVIGFSRFLVVELRFDGYETEEFVEMQIPWVMEVYIVGKCMRGWIHASLFHVGAYVTQWRRLERGNY
jgi:hypothetical protein